MSFSLTLGGIRFHVPVDMYAPDDGFFDIEIDAEWVPKESEPDGVRLDAPWGLAVWVDPEQPSIRLPILHEQAAVWQWQLRQVTPIVAAWHDNFTIHASAVALDDAGYAFVGASGEGKSTLAWELTKAGARPVADDLACIRYADGPSIALSGEQVSIAKIFFLSRTSDELAVTPLTKTESLQMHLRNGFGEHGNSRVWSFQFDACHRLAESVPHFTLTVPDDRERLPSIASELVSSLPSSEVPS